jgi:hypothetical protein
MVGFRQQGIDFGIAPDPGMVDRCWGEALVLILLRVRPGFELLQVHFESSGA